MIRVDGEGSHVKVIVSLDIPDAKEWDLTEDEYTRAISQPCFYCGGLLPTGSVGI